MNGRGSNLLMNCMWYEDIQPEQLADELQISTNELYEKIFGEKEFTMSEINQAVALLGLTETETDAIFFS